MLNVRKGVRSAVVLAAIVVVGLIAARWLAVTVRGTAVGAVLNALLVLVPPILGVSVWRRKGRSWLAALSWAVPLFAWMAVATWVRETPALIAGMMGAGGIAWTLLMIDSNELVAAWYRYVLRSQPPPDRDA
jgi:hypothetical protein